VASPSTPVKRILVGLERGVNYIFHLVAVARAGFDSEYADTYRWSVRPNDVGLLEKHASELAFKDGHTGHLAGLLVFHPAYLGLSSREAFEEYFQLVVQGLAHNDYRPFLERYREGHEALRGWYVEVDEQWLARHEPYAEVVERLGRIYVSNYDRYENEVWPGQAREMQPVADKLSAHFAQRDIIDDWEKLTGRQFRGPDYRIVLCSAIKNGPTAVSLGHNRTVFYYGHGLDWMKDFISHETGTHILIELLKEVVASCEYPFDVAYTAYENLCRELNKRVLGRHQLYAMPPNYNHARFEEIFARLKEKHPHNTPRELYYGALECFGSLPRGWVPWSSGCPG